MIETLLDSLGRMLDPSSPTVYLIALAGGLLSSLLPCSLSSLPLVIGYVGSGRSDLWKSFRLSAVFALGMAVTFTLLAAAALALGSLIGTTSRWWYLILGLLMLMMALQMLGVFTFIPATNLQTRTKRRGYIGALVAGILSGLFSSPCSTPVLVALLSIASATGDMVQSVLMLLCYALGYSVLSIAAGTIVGLTGHLSASRGYGRAMKVLEIVLGLAILILAFYMFYQGF